MTPPATKLMAEQAMAACGEGGLGLVQKTTALLIILLSSSLNGRLRSSVWIRVMLTTTLAAAMTPSTILGIHWLACNPKWPTHRALGIGLWAVGSGHRAVGIGQ